MTRLDATVLVRQTGLSERFLGHQAAVISWGVDLDNPSPSHDAVTVDVAVQALGPDGKPIADQSDLTEPTLAVIPAGQHFYLGGENTLLGAVVVRSIRVLVAVGSTPTKRYSLPPVSNVHTDAAAQEITATMTNPYGSAISPFDYIAYVVLYNRSGRIVGGDTASIGGLAYKTIGSRGHASITDVFPDGVSAHRVASARVTVAPL